MSMIDELCFIARANLNSNIATRVIKVLHCKHYGIGTKTEEGIEECLRIYYEQKYTKIKTLANHKIKEKSKFSLFRNMFVNNSTINLK